MKEETVEEEMILPPDDHCLLGMTEVLCTATPCQCFQRCLGSTDVLGVHGKDQSSTPHQEGHIHQTEQITIYALWSTS